jgi:hypothetical protein
VARNHMLSRCFSARGCVLLVALCYASSLVAQLNVLTYHYDNARTGANTAETHLSPANVNANQFGKLFTQPVDGLIVGQPLYVSGVTVPGSGTHNVVYVTTQHDSVYAFDADNADGGNAAPLWHTSFIDPPNTTSVSISLQPCANETQFSEVGIMGTPVIDTSTGTLYVVGKANENGTLVFRLHALDISAGQEKNGGPILIQATARNSNNWVVHFKPQYQGQRPGLLLSGGVLYLAFGSMGCFVKGDTAQGWLMAYDPSTLDQKGAFLVSPDRAYGGNIWQSGSGPAVDNTGNIFFETADGFFDGNLNFGDSILKLAPAALGLGVMDYFTPYDASTLKMKDLDLGSAGVTILPDQNGPHPHLLVGAGKEGTVYLIDRDDMGHFNSTGDTQIVQSLPSITGEVQSVPVYWNNTVYVPSAGKPTLAFSVNNGMLSTTPIAKAPDISNNSTLSANGNTNGVLWAVHHASTESLFAYDAGNIAKRLYTSLQNSRDALGSTTHFATPLVANGRVYIGGNQQLVVYGLFPSLAATAGGSQSATVGSLLPTALRVQASDPYSGNALSGVQVKFSDGGAGGSFSPAVATTDVSGTCSSRYTLPTKSGTYTITASSAGFSQATFTEIVSSGPATTMSRAGGNNQSGTAGTILPLPIKVKVMDAYKNPVAGVQVSFSDGGVGGSLSSPVMTDNFGIASTFYTAPSQPQIVTITGSASGLGSLTFTETINAP